jgi:hypothetical protein
VGVVVVDEAHCALMRVGGAGLGGAEKRVCLSTSGEEPHLLSAMMTSQRGGRGSENVVLDDDKFWRLDCMSVLSSSRTSFLRGPHPLCLVIIEDKSEDPCSR